MEGNKFDFVEYCISHGYKKESPKCLIKTFEDGFELEMNIGDKNYVIDIPMIVTFNSVIPTTREQADEQFKNIKISLDLLS
jgi:hypothetical protein